MGYRELKITFRLHSGYASPWRHGTASQWQADTVFGRLCWACLHRYELAGLQELLRRSEEGGPPLILSNGFPTGYLPRPLFPEAAPASGSLAERRQRAAEWKETQRTELLTEAEFRRAINGQAPGITDPAKRCEVVRQEVRTRNSINRLTGTTSGPEKIGENPVESQLSEANEQGGGNLFTTAISYTERITFYARIAEDYLDRARALFADLAHWGAGKGASHGMGAVELEDGWFSEFEGFHCDGSPDGFLALSHFVPATGDPTDGRWHLFIKYGKFGDERASTAPDDEAEAQPFKRPLIMLEAGSVFRCPTVAPYYGRMVAGLSPHYQDARQYGLCYAVGCRWPATDEHFKGRG